MQAVGQQRGEVLQAALGQGEREADGVGQRGRGVGEGDRRGEARRAASVEVRHSGMTTTNASSSGTGTGRATGPGPHGHEPAGEAGGGVVGVALDLGGAGQQVVGRPAQAAEGVGGHQAGADGRRRRAEAAPERDAIAALHGQAVERSSPAASARQTRLEASSASSPAPSPVTRT